MKLMADILRIIVWYLADICLSAGLLLIIAEQDANQITQRMLVGKRVDEADGVYKGGYAAGFSGIPDARCGDVSELAAFGIGDMAEVLVHVIDDRIAGRICNGDDGNFAAGVILADMIDQIAVALLPDHATPEAVLNQ